MAAETLPVYCIKDFGNTVTTGNKFYINKLSAHLQQHTFVTRPHRHDFYILVCFTQGKGKHIIDFESYEIQPGAWFFLSPGQVHSWSLSDDVEGEILFFGAEFLESYFTGKKAADYSVFKNHIQFLSLTDDQQKPLLQLIEQIETEYTISNIGNNDILKDYLDILLIHISRLTESKDQAAQTDAGQWQLQELKHFIDMHYMDEQSPAFYAEKMHLSVKYLNEICKRYLNKTTTQLIHERIILEAKRLLVHEELSINQVADKLNFTDYSYFTKFFKKLVGITPGDFRKSTK
jgi:AraC-like DNA-binding protein